MKTVIYRVNLYKHGTWHERFRFIGRRPTRDDVLEAIERSRGKSLVYAGINTANQSRQIVEFCGMPEKDGPSAPAVYSVLGRAVAKVYIDKEIAWLFGDQDDI